MDKSTAVEEDKDRRLYGSKWQCRVVNIQLDDNDSEI